MTGAVVVGYTATDSGRDAVLAGARLAGATDSVLHLVMVVPNEGTRSAAVPPERWYESHLKVQARQWLAEAVAMVPEEVKSTGHVRFAESFAEGLIGAGQEFRAAMIVVGAAGGGIFGRHRLGTVASELLHSSPIPVVLVPAGFGKSIKAAAPVAPLARVTVAIGNRPGANVLLKTGVQLAQHSGSMLRLLSLAAIDVLPGLDTQAIRTVADAHGKDVLQQALELLSKDIEVETYSATGESIEDAVTSVAWKPDEIVLVGSSRLAQPRRLFLGSTAAKMLHELPVPLMVVPRDYQVTGD